MSERTARPRRWLAVAGALPLVLAVVAACASSPTVISIASPTPTTSQPSPTPTAPPTPTPTPTPTTHAPLKPTPRALADKAVRRLTVQLPAGAFSVAALNTKTGARYSYGAAGGMRTGSVIKLCILEALLLAHQDAHTQVTDSENKTATAMIEHSDNAATEEMYDVIGGRDGLVAALRRFGMKHTVAGPLPNYWGLTVTSAPDYLTVLGNLVSAKPLDSYSRGYALNLMRHVESDQRWGVGVVADPGTAFANKNGWLAVDQDNPGGLGDHGLWLVNSVGVLTVHHQQVLMAVFTQHGESFEDGVELVESLAKAIAPAVAG
jgi:beta-lactamase class A